MAEKEFDFKKGYKDLSKEFEGLQKEFNLLAERHNQLNEIHTIDDVAKETMYSMIESHIESFNTILSTLFGVVSTAQELSRLFAIDFREKRNNITLNKGGK